VAGVIFGRFVGGEGGKLVEENEYYGDFSTSREPEWKVKYAWMADLSG